ncbi:DUF3024 domain-containing protein [Microlunatus sp. Gsoil 973]|jgi:hypothetical protein|uniref:DUF3024 domain-containing protein n=1 Tax=Microlunatus sp. Gsoil 973 TaxID=2672569 RepID=UPI001E5AADD8|nr:DUF3024 domain-containing protein [Microlunatus sp. Gsoil 973]
MPETDVARVRRWCVQRVPEQALDQVRVECEVTPRHLTIVERRAPWRADYGREWTRFPIARLRYTKTTRTWSLFWRDRNLRFHRYDPLISSDRVNELLDEIDHDPTGIFWVDPCPQGIDDRAHRCRSFVPKYQAARAR